MKMRTLIFFFLIFFSSYAQNKISNQDQILFETTSSIESLPRELCLGCRGNKTEFTKKDSLKIEYGTELEKQITEIAIENYTKLIDSFPKSRFFYKALMRKAENEYYLKRNLEAKNSFEKILKSKELNPNTENYYEVQESLLKNNSAIKLAEIFIIEKNYEKAINYLNESKKYNAKYLCGTSYRERTEELKKLYEICETQLKK